MMEVARMRTWADEARTPEEVAWCRWTLASIAAASDVAMAAGVEGSDALEMIVAVFVAACEAFKPRPELREQVLADLALAVRMAREGNPN